MTTQTVFQILIAVGIILTAIGSIGSHFAGLTDNIEKERLFNEQIEVLQTSLTISIEQNSELTKAFTKEVVEESTRKQIRSDILDEARKKQHAKKMVSPNQRAAVTGQKQR